MLETKFQIVLDLEVLRKYHPVFEIEYQNCPHLKLPTKVNREIVLFPNFDDKSQLQEYCKITIDLDTLKVCHFDNMFGIVSAYKETQDPNYVKRIKALTNRFSELVLNLYTLDKLDEKSGIQVISNLSHQFGKSNGFQINYNTDLGNIAKVLKAYFITQLHQLKSEIQSFTHEQMIHPLESYTDIAMAIGENQNICRNYKVSYHHLNRMMTLVKVQNTDYDSDFLRMIYKTLMEYLNNEVTDTMSKNKKFRIIYQVCYALDLYKDRLTNKIDQKERVYNVFKNFKEDKRPKITM